MSDLLKEPVVSYLDRLASGEPTPGGGSAAALAGAMAAALLAMVARFTVGREKYAIHEATASSVLAEADRLRTALQILIERDAAAYGYYRDACALPRSTEEEKVARHAAIQDATRISAEEPLATARACTEVLAQAARLVCACNPYLVSDVAVATYHAMGGLRSAMVNVRVNLAVLEDESFVGATIAEMERLNDEASGSARAALAKSFQVMGIAWEATQWLPYC
jgi:methenyltetrahydrofolate cyclohydrolase